MLGIATATIASTLRNLVAFRKSPSRRTTNAKPPSKTASTTMIHTGSIVIATHPTQSALR